ncbi:cell division protein FtsB [Catalinimonas alkaloidigena]|uniref:hypothetical protein n=1 Tax=Catalinimonas alkaloidigena TaxID=1075417 RepID=UPI0024066E23|nr:hypothetical protein [Catalinimonas alkaloidigena]MDF9798323.1 cell division protein FtsB [Catalinimonas alkaloidigena]
MKPFKLTLFLLLLLYHAVFVGIAINNSWEWVSTNLQTVQWITITALVLFLILLLINILERQSYQGRIQRLEAEKDKIKAKVYDMQRRNEEIDESIKSFEQSVENKEKNKNQDKDKI